MSEIEIKILRNEFLQFEGVEIVDRRFMESHEIVRFRAVSKEARILVWSRRLVYNGKRTRSMILIVQAYEFDGKEWRRVI